MRVMKAGGELLAADDSRRWVAEQVRDAASDGPVVFVHGGGPQLDAACVAAGLESPRVAGRRVTSPEVLELAIGTWRGHGSVGWVAALARVGLRAVGLCGLDGGLLLAVRRPAEPVDYGAVGDLVEVRTDVLVPLLEAGFVPVVSPLAGTAGAEVLNVNADTVAARLAVALGAQALTLLTTAAGIRSDPHDPATVVPETDLAGLQAMRAAGTLQGGMLPKAAAVEAALRGGVSEVQVGGTRIVFKPD